MNIKQPPKKQNPETRSMKLIVRVNAREATQLKRNAKLFTKGCISEWLRFTGMNYKVKKDDVQE